MAQLDNAADSDSEERGFESLQAGQRTEFQPFGWNSVVQFVGIRTSRKKNSPVDCFLGAATSVSEAIGTAVPRQNPFKRAKNPSDDSLRDFYFSETCHYSLKSTFGIS